MPRFAHKFWLVILFIGCAACGEEPSASLVALNRRPQSLDEVERPTFRRCEGRTFEGAEPVGFKHWESAMWSSQGAFHSAQDVLIGAGSNAVHTQSWFEYGIVHHPLPGQDIQISMDNCDAFTVQGRSHTDSTGWAGIHFETPAVGRYTLMHQALEDGSVAAARLFVLPPQTHVVLFDIDGTLTINDAQYIQQMVNPSYVPVPFPDAVHATHKWRDKGYVIVYLTGRPHNAAGVTRRWLNRLGFAVGAIHLTEANADMGPSNDGVGDYKAAFIGHLQRLRLIVDYAYGNATTDVYAYKKAGLHNAQIYMLGDNAGSDGTQPLPKGYTEHLAFIDQAPVVTQPFSW